MWGERLGEVQKNTAAVANAIAAFEPVTMLAQPADADACRARCGGQVTVLPVGIDDSWMRDSGPNFVVSNEGELAASIFHFNAWGAKHAPWGRDAAVGHRVAEYLGIRTFTSTIFMEGGGVNVDGEGTLLTTEQCVLHPNRNPGLDRDCADQALRDALGVSRVIWLPGDPEDSETDGHIDGIACFVSPGRVLVELCPAKGTRRYDNTRANLEAVRGQADACGRTLEVETIDEAWEATRTSEIFAGSYVNYYIANGAVIMPGVRHRQGCGRARDAGAAPCRPGDRAGGRDSDRVRRRRHSLHDAAAAGFRIGRDLERG